MSDTPPPDLVPVSGPPADLVPVKADSATAPAKQGPRFDVIGDIKKSWSDALGQLESDASGAVARDMKDVVGAAGKAQRLPMDAFGLAAAVPMSVVRTIGGGALSLPLEAMDRVQGVKPEDYNKPFKTPFGHETLKDPVSAGREFVDDAVSMIGPGKIAGKAFNLGETVEAAKPAVMAGREQSAVDSAGRTVAKRAAQDALTPEKIAEEQAKAATTGDKFSLMDMGKNLRNLGGKTFRGPGEGSTLIDDFLKMRDKAVGPQLDKEISAIAKGSTYDAVNHLYGARSEAAAPIFKKAFERGSTAPFETQYQNHFAEAGKMEQEALNRVKQARNAVTIAESRATKTANVYSAPTPGELKAARDQLATAEAQFKAIQGQKEATRALLHRAQLDGTANAPGAVWSPRLQELMADPDVQMGIRRGLKIEKKNALAEGRPFEDHDYSIIGYDDKGEPVIGAVPTMKMLAAAKEGLDAVVLDQVHPIGHTSAGRPTKEGLANRKLRDEFRKELVALNPTYGQALEAWSGPSESIDAMRMGQEHFTSGDTIEQTRAEFNALTESNKEFYRLGAAEHLINKEKGVALGGDETKAVHNSRKDEERLRMLFKTQGEADQFLESVARKRQMFDTKQKVAGGSDTAERIAEDRSRLATAGQHFLTAAERGMKGHPLTAGREAWRGAQALITNERKAKEIAKLLTDPNVKLPVKAAGPVRRDLGTLLRTARPEDIVQQLGLPAP